MQKNNIEILLNAQIVSRDTWKLKSRYLWFSFNSTIVFSFLAILLAGVLAISLFGSFFESFAQSPPVPPPPSPSIQGSNEEDVRENQKIVNDKSAPVIQILTKELTEGKNLIRVKITDDNRITGVTVRYAENGFIKSADMVQEEGPVYKGLIHAISPSSVLVFDAADAQGNVGELPMWFNVQPVQKNFFDNFFDWLRSVFS